MTRPFSKRTRAVHGGARRSQYGELSEAIFLTQGFAYDSAESAEARFIEAGEDEFIYARYGNPTVRMFEDRVAQIEGAEDAFATASGMAAVSGALMAMLRAGDHVVSARALFGSCLYVLEEVLTRYGVDLLIGVGDRITGPGRGMISPILPAKAVKTALPRLKKIQHIGQISQAAQAQTGLVAATRLRPGGVALFEPARSVPR